MTLALPAPAIASKLEAKYPGILIEAIDNTIIVKTEYLFEAAAFLKVTPGLDFNYLSYVTAVDYQTHFDVIYKLVSLEHNHCLVLKTRCNDHENAAVSSVVSLWQGADFQEREIYDLMGIKFHGHPNLKRIFLWEGFKGHPLRKDFKQQ